MICWNDLLMMGNTEQANQKISKGSLIQLWRSDRNLIKLAADKGYDLINSDQRFSYFDRNHSDLSLKKVYSFEPIPEGLSFIYHHKVKGVCCQLWGEWMPTNESLEQQLYPRLSAYAEVAWTESKNKSFRSFDERMKHQFVRWRKQGISFRKNSLSPFEVSAVKAMPFLAWWKDQEKKLQKRIDCTGFIKGNGEYECVFWYKSGVMAAQVNGVKLFKNGKLIDLDVHDGFAGAEHKNVFYYLKINDYDFEAKYEIELDCKVNNSYGELRIKRL